MIKPFDEKILNFLRERNILEGEIYKRLVNMLQISNKDIQTILLEQNILEPSELIKIISEILKWKIMSIENPEPNPEALKIIPSFLTKFYKFIPLKVENKTLHVGFTLPINPAAVDDIVLITGYSVVPYILDVSSKDNLKKETLIMEKSEVVDLQEKIIELKEEKIENVEKEELEIVEETEEKVIELKEEDLESIEKIVEEVQKVNFEEPEEKIIEENSVIKEVEETEESKKEERSKSKLIMEKIIGAVKDTLPRGDALLRSEKATRVPRRKLLGEILIEEGIITKEQLEIALEESHKRAKPLGETLLELKYINDYQLAQVLSIQLGFPFKSLKEIKIDPEIAKMINFSKAKQDLILPLYKENNRVVVAMVDPANIMALDDIKMITKSEVEPVVVPKNEFLEVINRLWKSQEMKEIIEDFTKVEEETQTLEVSEEEIREETGPTAKLVNSLLLEAVDQGASDIHIEPMEKGVRVRFRVDGILHQVANFAKKYHAPIVSRIKIISDMDIAERRVPQDGRIKMVIKGNTYDFRVSTLPGVFGEKVVLRILGRGEISLSLESLGFREENYKKYLKMLKTPYGIILVTGPTGSGKSTTLYASLNMINSPDINIITVEDPVEYQLPGIHQVQVNPKAGLDFAAALRSILRQDPDVILVGEIRDEETARIAIQAALTGHLVLSTLHTNDAPSTITRLIDMGIEPFLISSSLLGAVAQRLVRKICPNCKTSYEPTSEELEILESHLHIDVKNITLYKGKGCSNCNNRGYKGRTAIHEVMVIDDDIRELILKKVSKETIREAARRKGMNTLREDGLFKVLEGITTIEEVMRVTAAD
ncbi:MAG: type II secretion system ATPase GspE [Dictyoglomus sp.]|nr:type II secretion system ATPase GspE [Dictyoglomus sp.]MCX7942484.1 type II secretion system ATPase GspE [Dictyoglomaceae bacterium]MDW8187712.1 type II secretion system ATPase GspE [Dictyoglomus sp.]